MRGQLLIVFGRDFELRWLRTAMQRVILTGPPIEPHPPAQKSTEVFSLVILWSAREPHRVGESANCFPSVRYILGRAPTVSSGESPLCFHPRRPGTLAASQRSPNSEASELLGESISRRQLELFVDDKGLYVRNVGRCPLWLNGSLTGTGTVMHGDTIHLQQQLLLLCVRTPLEPSPLRFYPVERAGDFGHADKDGIVGESTATWRLREEIAASAVSEGHVLVLGATGSGKELVAQMVHQLSSRKQQSLVVDNISTMPSSLGAAMLFGNRRHFPNPGMEERKGLLGLAEGGSLFLDELGDMSDELQPMLLRVMERTGEYTRLGEESQPRRANIRVIGATNRPERIRIELRRRFQHEIIVPELTERREDIPLLLRHLLRMSANSRRYAARFLSQGEPRIDPLLIEQLVHHPYSTHVAELAFLIERALKDSEGEILRPFTGGLPRLHGRLGKAQSGPVASSPPCDHETVTFPLPSLSSARLPSPQEAQQALDDMGGSVVRAATALSITRHQLNRLIRKSGLVVNRPSLEHRKQPERTSRTRHG